MKRYFFYLLLLVQAGWVQARTQMAKDTVLSRSMNPVTVVASLCHDFSIPSAVLDSSVLMNHSYATPADALAKLPGVSLARDGAWATSVNVRGLSEQRLLFLVDGDRIQTSSDIAVALSAIDMGTLNKIEVVKGAASVLYGSGAMGGVVNFVSQRPGYSERFRVTGKAESSINSVNGLWANNANVNFSTKQWYIALNGSVRTAGNTTSPKGEVASSQFHDASWSLRSGIKYSPNEEFLVNYQHVKGWDIGLPGVNAFSSAALARYKAIKRDQLSAEYIVTDLNDYLTRLSVKAYTQSVEREVEVYPYGEQKYYPKTRLYPGSTNQSYGAKVVSDWELEENQTAYVGAEILQRKLETFRLRQVYSSDSLLTVTGEQPTANSKQTNVGAFAYYTWSIVPAKLKLNVGARADYFRTENDSAFNPVFKHTVVGGTVNNVTNLTRTTLFVAQSATEFGYAGHIDMQYNVAQRHSLALSLANSYRAASLDERFKFIDLGSVVKVGNPELKPEWGTFANLNYTYRSGSLLVKADVYMNYLFNMIAEKAGTFQGRAAYINANINQAFLTGTELETRWNLSSHFIADANLAYVFTRDVKNSKALPQIPPMNGKVAFLYQSGGFLDVELLSEWAADQNEFASGETRTPGYVKYDINLHTTPIALQNTTLAFFAGIDNLLDKAYYNHLASVRSGGARYYEPGRNFWAKLRLNF